MINSYGAMRRLEEALRYRGFSHDQSDVVGMLGDKLLARATDREVNELLHHMLSILEPPVCTMTHCPDYGGSSRFCGCGLGRVPGRCPVHRAFLQRKKERELRQKGGGS